MGQEGEHDVRSTSAGGGRGLGYDGRPPVRTSSLMDSIHKVSAVNVAVISKGMNASERRWRHTQFARTNVLVSLIPAPAKNMYTPVCQQQYTPESNEVDDGSFGFDLLLLCITLRVFLGLLLQSCQLLGEWAVSVKFRIERRMNSIPCQLASYRLQIWCQYQV